MYSNRPWDYNKCSCGRRKLRESRVCRRCWNKASPDEKWDGRSKIIHLCACGKPKSTARTLKCRDCYHEGRRSKPKHCYRCGVPLTQANWRESDQRHKVNRCVTCGRKILRENYKKHKQDKIQERIALKKEVMSHYGGKCACCGEQELAFLTIDHVANNGKAHRAAIGMRTIYWWLRKNGYPQEGYQCLCWNCNMAKSKWYGGCPHQQKKRGAVAHK